jgi:hypothetical protein
MGSKITNEKLKKELDSLIFKLSKAELSKAETEYRTNAKEDYNYYAGHQDSDVVLAALEEQDRPDTTYNEIKTRIDTLVGLAGQNKYNHKMVPVSGSDGALAELASKALFHYRRKLKLVQREIECFTHTVKSGRSLLWFYINTENPFKPKIACKRFNGDQFIVDPNSTRLDMSDASYIALDTWVEKEQLQVMAPNLDYRSVEFKSNKEGELDYFNEVENLYRIIEIWYRKWERVNWFENPLTGKLEWLRIPEFKQFQKVLFSGLTLPDGTVYKSEKPLVFRESLLQTMNQFIFTGNSYIIEHNQDPYKYVKGFPGALYGAYKDDNNNSWFGSVRMAKDPQFAFNTLRRQLSHLIQTLPKGMLIHEVGVILNIDEYEEDSAKPNFHLEVAKGQLDKVKFEKQPTISNIYQTFGLELQKSIQDATGVPDNLMGITASREPGVTLEKKQLYAFAVLYILFSNYSESRLRGSEILFGLMQEYTTEAELIRIEGIEGDELIQINTETNPQSEGFNDISALEYDLELDETVESATMRQATAQLIMDYSHNNPGTVPPDVILEYSDIPLSVVQKIKTYHDAVKQLEQDNIEADRALKFKELEVEIIKVGRDPKTLEPLTLLPKDKKGD